MEKNFRFKWLARIFYFIIKFYQFFLRPVLPSSCRFYPSCSEYACQALAAFGPFKGGWLITKRLLKCHPWHPGGYDSIHHIKEKV